MEQDRNFLYRDISNIWYEKLKIERISKGDIFDLTLDQIADIMENQLFRCYYSGQELVYPRFSKSSYYEGRITLIDPNNGYVYNNIRFVSRIVNNMKNSMGEIEFLEMCNTIVNKNN